MPSPGRNLNVCIRAGPDTPCYTPRMRAKLASLLLFGGVLVACGNSDSGDGGGSGGKNTIPTFSVTYSPNKETFKVAKGSSAPLTVTVSITSSDTAAVQLIFTSGVVGLNISPSNTTIKGSGSTTVTVTTIANVDSKPYFTVLAQGLDKNGDKRNQYSLPTTFQWTAQ